MGTVSDAVKNQMLDALCRNVAFQITGLYVQLHTGAPGSAGTSNVASNTTRKQATFGTGAASGAIANTVAVEWDDVPATETYTHASLWSASTGGTFVGSDDLSAPAEMNAGDTFRIPAGDIDITL